jgi:hypothetical protein
MVRGSAAASPCRAYLAQIEKWGCPIKHRSFLAPGAGAKYRKKFGFSAIVPVTYERY